MEDRRPSIVSQVTEAVGLLTALAALTYIAGALLVLERLAAHGYGRLASVVHLPREYLIGLGLLVTVLPVITILVLYVAMAVLRPAVATWRPSRGRALLCYFALLAATAIAVALAGEGAMTRDDAVHDLPAFGMLLVGTAYAVVALELIGQMPGRSAKLLLARGMLLGTLAIPFAIAIGTFVPLEVAKVCTASDQVVGFLVAEASDRVYLAELPHDAASDDDVRRIVSIPREHAERMFIARSRGAAEVAACVSVPPKRSPEAAPQRAPVIRVKGAQGPPGAQGPRGPRGRRGPPGLPGRSDP